MSSYPVVLSIAGSDSSGGAGIQADIKTLSMLSCYAATAITAVTAQNTCVVSHIEPISADTVRAQCLAVLEDLNVSVIKIGMLFSESIIVAVSEVLHLYPHIPVILDPVMVSQQGAHLLKKKAQDLLVQHIVPSATLVTPNLDEAALFYAGTLSTEADMSIAAFALAKRFNTAVLLKGGHRQVADAQDVLACPSTSDVKWFKSTRVNTTHTHGTGCTLSAAIAGYMAQGNSMIEAIKAAKQFISAAIESGQHLSIGRGFGPVNHLWRLGEKDVV